jgi:hypothetical protein
MAFVAFIEIKTIIKTGGVHAFSATLASSATGMNFDCDSLTDLEFVYAWPSRDYRSHVFVTRRPIFIKR